MKKTIGHRGVDPTGETTYKKVSLQSDVSSDNGKGKRGKLGYKRGIDQRVELERKRENHDTFGNVDDDVKSSNVVNITVIKRCFLFAHYVSWTETFL